MFHFARVYHRSIQYYCSTGERERERERDKRENYLIDLTVRGKHKLESVLCVVDKGGCLRSFYRKLKRLR